VYGQLGHITYLIIRVKVLVVSQSWDYTGHIQEVGAGIFGRPSDNSSCHNTCINLSLKITFHIITHLKMLSFFKKTHLFKFGTVSENLDTLLPYDLVIFLLHMLA
jgi:hypothetical protein